MSRWTRQQLAAKGYRPDRGGLVRLTDAEWQTRVNALAHGNEPPKVRAPVRICAHQPNATEARYGDILRVRYQEPHVVLYEPLSFRLLSGALFTPDWIVFDGPTILAAWEVKGARGHHSHSRSALAWKTCANEWPMIMWGWAKWKSGEFLETVIPPK